MAAPKQIDSVTIEIHPLNALEDSSGLIRKGERYITLAGGERPPCEVKMPLTHRDFVQNLNRLRYAPGVSPRQVQAALDALAGYAAQVLPELPVTNRKALQIDLVLGSAELWAFPFEACRHDDDWAFADRDRCTILTRRIRQGFAASRRPWPVRPHVLIVHAPVADDLHQGLIDAHVGALERALGPWAVDPQAEGLLEVVHAVGARDLRKAMERAQDGDRGPFTHVHVLAHGKEIADPDSGSIRWGLRLGDVNRGGTDPQQLAESLRPIEGNPVVVTVAACDSGNQVQTTIPERSFAQELHVQGIPIVLASQLPLTKRGSVTWTRTFYELLLQGEDARWALHAARLALHDDDEAGHDWVSLVGYVQLPEGYADHLREVGVRREMALLKAARDRLDRGLEERGGILDGIEPLIRRRIASLNSRLDEIARDQRDLRGECQGVLASAHKRLAELKFHESQRADTHAEAHALRRLSRDSLEAALGHYAAAYSADLQNHWLGVQQLALEAVLVGSCKNPSVWDVVFHAARLAAARNENEYEAHGTIAELWLLGPIIGRPRALGEAKAALACLVSQAERAGASCAIASARHQLERYASWWTKDNGFFGAGNDLAADAEALLNHLNVAESDPRE